MPPKKKTKEEILLKAKLSRRQRYAAIKADPIKYALEKEKEHQRYLKRKEAKKLLNIKEMTPETSEKNGEKLLKDIIQKSEGEESIEEEGQDNLAEDDPLEDRRQENLVSIQNLLVTSKESSLLEKTKKRMRRQSVTVSDCMRHDAAAVLAHILPLIELVTWNYTEAGHGKGAADGIGGTVKRLDDAAVAHGNNIVSIDDFVSVVTYSTASSIIKIIEEHKF
ncbi:unnamed protein product [Colias eurytheme]|nr:unnamed protein product [Colias eurytheme]